MSNSESQRAARAWLCRHTDLLGMEPTRPKHRVPPTVPFPQESAFGVPEWQGCTPHEPLHHTAWVEPGLRRPLWETRVLGVTAVVIAVATVALPWQHPAGRREAGDRRPALLAPPGGVGEHKGRVEDGMVRLRFPTCAWLECFGPTGSRLRDVTRSQAVRNHYENRAPT